MKKKSSIMKFVAGSAVAALLLAGCTSGESGKESGGSGKDEVIKIGAVLPMTGPSAVFGTKFQEAYTLAIDEINEDGGIDGKKLELVIEDSQEKPPVGKTATEKLISNKEILAITGGRSSGVTLVEAQTAEEHKMPYLIDHGSSDKATMEGYEYVYRLNPTSGMYTDAFREYLKENPIEGKVAYINVDNAFGEAVHDYGLKKYFDESGVEHKVYKYKAGELDLKPIMEQVKAYNPEVVIMTAGDDNDATQLIKAANESGLSPKMFVGTGAGHSIQGFADQAGKLAETVVTAGPWHGDKKDPAWKEFKENFVEKYGHEPGEHEVEGYSAMYVLADALERADELDRESVKEALDETDMKTIFGPVKFEDFDGYKNQNRGKSDVSQWIDGKMKTVYPADYAETELVPFRGW